MTERPVVDTRGNAWLAGLPYTDQDATIDDGTVVSVSLTPAGEDRVRLEVPGRGAWTIAHERVALDRSAEFQPRRWPPPAQVLIAGDGSPTDLPVEPDRLDPQSIEEVVMAPRSVRLVVVDPATPTAAHFVVRLSAVGVVCAVAGPSRIRGLGDRFAASLRVEPADIARDDLQWAATRARQSRALWLDHDLRIAWENGPSGWAPRIAAVPLPTVSILLASRRPDMVPASLDAIAAQETVVPEVIVGLHGASSEDVARITGELAARGLDGQVLDIPPELPVGAVLNACLDRASGDWVLKWDDDDLYGRHHLEDLVVAARRSGAPLVGKRPEFIHFAESNQTVFRTAKGADRDAANVAGGTMLANRDLLRSVGGFAPTVMAPDFHLRNRYAALGLRIHRTHGFGFVMARRTAGHTWQVTEEQLRTKVVRTWDGIPEIADVG